MKKILCAIMAIFFCVALTACGGLNEEEQNNLAQYEVWRGQAEEIEPLLRAAAYADLDLYDVELSVRNTNGKNATTVNVVYYKAYPDPTTAGDFGTIVGLVSEKYLSLIDEYPEYDFDDVYFYYYIDANPKDILSISYRLSSNGEGAFSDTRKSQIVSLSLTPDEVFDRLNEE